jgi:hypothetical protein
MEKPVEKISLGKCKSVLESDGSKYTDEEVLQIRDFLYLLAELDYKVYLKQKQREIDLENEKQKTEEEDFKQAA